MAKVKSITTIKDLTPDTQNANKHTQRGMGMMETSIEECGFGDSMTVDKHGNVISGNGRLETLAAIDMTDAIVVQSDGTRPVIHQRTDLDLRKDEKAKRLGILQNRTGQTNLEWDTDVLAQLAAEGVELDDLFSADELSVLLNITGEPANADELWEGMPEFEHEDLTAYQIIRMNFRNEADVQAFAQLIGQKLTPKTKYAWHPHKEIEHHPNESYGTDS